MGTEEPVVASKLRTPRAAAIAGILFSVLLISSQLLIWTSIPGKAAAKEVIRNSRAVSLALNLLPFAGIAFLWFIAVVRDRLGALEDRFFATVFLGSGLLYLAMIFGSAALAGGLIRVLLIVPERLAQAGAYSLTRAEIYQTMNVYGIKMAGVFMFHDLNDPAANRDCSALDFVPRLCFGGNAVAKHWKHRLDSTCLPSVGVFHKCRRTD